jgi:hypothetical protein
MKKFRFVHYYDNRNKRLNNTICYVNKYGLGLTYSNLLIHGSINFRKNLYSFTFGLIHDYS